MGIIYKFSATEKAQKQSGCISISLLVHEIPMFVSEGNMLRISDVLSTSENELTVHSTECLSVVNQFAHSTDYFLSRC